MKIHFRPTSNAENEIFHIVTIKYKALIPRRDIFNFRPGVNRERWPSPQIKTSASEKIYNIYEVVKIEIQFNSRDGREVLYYVDASFSAANFAISLLKKRYLTLSTFFRVL